MTKLILLMTLFYTAVCHAESSPPSPVHIGVDDREGSHSFTVHNITFFDHRPWYRYGYGDVGLNLGKYSAIRGHSTGGYPLIWSGDYLTSESGIFLSGDFGNTTFNWSKGDIHSSFYSLMPAAGLGFYSRMGNLSIDLVAKSGYAITNLRSGKLLSPDSYKYNGWQVFTYITPVLGFSFDQSRFLDYTLNGKLIYFKLAEDKTIVFREDEFSFDKEETTRAIMFNMEF